MERLIVDMDDVMADATGRFIECYELEFGVRVERESLNGKEEGHGFPDHHHIVKEFPFRPDFFRYMQVNKDCESVIRELNQKYELFIVSAAMEFPLSLAEKLEWLKQHFPFLTWRQFVFCGSKAVVHGHYMIDDLPYNLERFNGEKLLFNAPHNTHIQQFKRVNNWVEVGDYLL